MNSNSAAKEAGAGELGELRAAPPSFFSGVSDFQIPFVKFGPERWRGAVNRDRMVRISEF